MRWVGIEPTTSWIGEKVKRKLREKEWSCGGLILQSPCLKREREGGKERKWCGGDGDQTRIPQIWKMQLSRLILD